VLPWAPGVDPSATASSGGLPAEVQQPVGFWRSKHSLALNFLTLDAQLSAMLEYRIPSGPEVILLLRNIV